MGTTRQHSRRHFEWNTKADRLLAEMGGIGLAFVFGIAGVVTGNVSDNLNEDQGS